MHLRVHRVRRLLDLLERVSDELALFLVAIPRRLQHLLQQQAIPRHALHWLDQEVAQHLVVAGRLQLARADEGRDDGILPEPAEHPHGVVVVVDVHRVHLEEPRIRRYRHHRLGRALVRLQLLVLLQVREELLVARHDGLNIRKHGVQIVHGYSRPVRVVRLLRAEGLQGRVEHILDNAAGLAVRLLCRVDLLHHLGSLELELRFHLD
mmetsp:Transcript_20023/g.60643  ORF Transcript_20023/g.60643 Transcript_20023/m.60643 type:complete len:208 (-) Transcript_20023:726-1349(-)